MGEGTATVRTIHARHEAQQHPKVQLHQAEPRFCGSKFALMLHDDYSSHVWFFAITDSPIENASRLIVYWAAAFGVPNGLMSDGPTHFWNETIDLVAKGLKTPHHFKTPYCLWSDGVIDRFGMELIQAFRVVLSELQLRHGE